MTDLAREIAAFERHQADLEREFPGKWVIFRDGEFFSADYDTFEDAADDATRRFGRGPYLIRQIGKLAIRADMDRARDEYYKRYPR